MPSSQIEVCNPATGELLGTVPDADAAEIDRAVAAARASFESKTWRGLDPSKRERILRNIGDLLMKNRLELAQPDLAGDRKDAARGRRSRRRAGRRLLSLLRRLGAQALRADHPGGRSVPELYAARTGRRGGGDRAVEFPAADGGVESRAGIGLRLLGGAQAFGAHAAERAAAGGDMHGGAVCPRARSTWSRATVPTAGEALALHCGCRQDQLHGLCGDGAEAAAELRRFQSQAPESGTGRQVAEHRLPGRRLRGRR